MHPRFAPGYRTGGAIEVISRGDAERELSTLVALHRGLGLACEPLPLDEARKMEPTIGRDALAAAFLRDECSIEPRGWRLQCLMRQPPPVRICFPALK